AAPLTPGASVSGTLAPANSTTVYQFQATAGDRFYFYVAAADAVLQTAFWRLTDLYGNLVFGTSLHDVATLSLPRTRVYTLLVEGDIGSSGTGSYAINVEPVVPSVQPLTVGAVVNGNIATPGRQDTYPFHLASDAQLYFDALAPDSLDLAWTLSSPAGVE